MREPIMSGERCAPVASSVTSNVEKTLSSSSCGRSLMEMKGPEAQRPDLHIPSPGHWSVICICPLLASGELST